jgi:hypothetical protein
MPTAFHYMVTLRPRDGVPVTFWILSTSEGCAVKKAKMLMDEPSTLVDISPVMKPAAPKDAVTAASVRSASRRPEKSECQRDRTRRFWR